MRNMAVLHSPAFSYPLPVLVRVLFNLLIFKGKILYYNKYSDLYRKGTLKSLVFFKNKYILSEKLSCTHQPFSPESLSHLSLILSPYA